MMIWKVCLIGQRTKTGGPVWQVTPPRQQMKRLVTYHRVTKHSWTREKAFAEPYFVEDKRETSLRHCLHFELAPKKKKREPNDVSTRIRDVKLTTWMLPQKNEKEVGSRSSHRFCYIPPSISEGVWEAGFLSGVEQTFPSSLMVYKLRPCPQEWARWNHWLRSIPCVWDGEQSAYKRKWSFSQKWNFLCVVSTCDSNKNYRARSAPCLGFSGSEALSFLIQK